MAATYFTYTLLASDKVTVFPAAGRSDYPQATLLTEDNIRHIYNEEDSFVITETPAWGADNKSFTTPFEFVIKGYHFAIQQLPDSFSKNDIISVAICLKTNLENDSYKRLEPLSSDPTITQLDDSDKFQGLGFIKDRYDKLEPESSRSGCTYYVLDLFANGNVLSSAKQRIKAANVFYNSDPITKKLKIETLNTGSDNITTSKIVTGVKTVGSVTDKCLTIRVDITQGKD